MKLRYILLTFAFFATQLAVKAQIVNNLVVFSNEGQPFTLILDGLKENQTPATNVRVVGLDLKAYQVKVIYENKKLRDANTTITFFRTGKECVFGLNKKGKKKHTIVYVSEKEIDGFIDPAMQQNLADLNTSTLIQASNPTPVTTPAISVFQEGLNNIIAQPTDAAKLTAASALLQINSLDAAQVKQILASFSNEQTKLAFAKQVCVKTPSVCVEIINSFVSGPLKQELQFFLQNKK